MTAFDPYHKWLGIPATEQPPNHYRLLGVSLFESDLDVIDAAANRQMAYVRSRAGGEHAAPSQQLLNELSAARICLLNAKDKTTYDQSLRKHLALSQPATTASSPTAVRRSPSESTPPLIAEITDRQRQRGPVLPPPAGVKPASASSPPTAQQRDPLADPFAHPNDAHERLRQALRSIMADGVITEDERLQIQRFREKLGISSEDARRIFAAVKIELAGLAKPPAAPAPPAKPTIVPQLPSATIVPASTSGETTLRRYGPSQELAPAETSAAAHSGFPDLQSQFVEPLGQRRIKDNAQIRARVRGPAVALITIGGLGALFCIVGIFVSVAMTSASSRGDGAAGFYLLGAATQGFVAYAGVQMMNLRKYSTAIIGSVLSMLPCSFCCFIGLPLGIWSLSVLGKSEVKQVFR